MWERSARTFSIGDNVGIGKPAIWSRRTFEYICMVYILAVNGPSRGRRVTPPLRAYTFIIIKSDQNQDITLTIFLSGSYTGVGASEGKKTALNLCVKLCGTQSKYSRSTRSRGFALMAHMFFYHLRPGTMNIDPVHHGAVFANHHRVRSPLRSSYC